ncbi:MAG: endonuclease [Bacteroidota bacterium]|nr:endonuclease [Bacteroidota bacterium]
MRRPLRIFFLYFVCLTNFLFAQAGSYYSTISSSSSSFIEDLKTRVRSPYTQISYNSFDETNIANFASRDTVGGQKIVTCVYSGDNYVYIPPFSWGYFSREHTFCHSWMPTYPSETGQEYSDQHHLFPTNQNSANGVRNNHPLGIVVNSTSTYGGAKFGKNSSGGTVYEPRDSHKGDAARAMLYMCLKYDGVNGTWNFNWLNNTRLPSLGEAPQDLNTLLQWHKMDPPDKWEVDRNNYIESIQHNRNPFVDHPEYVNYIDFNNMTLKTADLAVEPASQLTNLSATSTDSTITLSWTDASVGPQAPQGYLLVVYNRDNYIIPVDGASYSDDNNLSDGAAMVNIPYSSAGLYKFSNLPSATRYYFTIYTYNGTGAQRNYNTTNPYKTNFKTTGLLPTKVYFSSPGATVSESKGSYSLEVSISDPSLTTATTAQVVLTSGDSTDIGNFTAQTITFPAGSTASQIVNVTITDDTLSESKENLTFTLRNVSGGTAAQAGTQGSFNLTIEDNDSHSGGGGNETFAAIKLTNSYSSGSFTGQDGSTWTYNLCMNSDNTNKITSPSPILKKDATAKIQSGTISGGCGSINFKYVQAFSGNVNLGLYINDNLVYTATTSSEQGIIKSAGPIAVNVKGDFTMRFQQLTSGAQATLDDIIWTGYDGTSDVEENKLVARSTRLSQSYPNPCNPGATISYSVTGNSYVTLKVYDMMGRQVATLVDGNKSMGQYSVKFDGSSLASGIYIYKLTAGSETIIRKLSLLK